MDCWKIEPIRFTEADLKFIESRGIANSDEILNRLICDAFVVPMALLLNSRVKDKPAVDA